MASVCPGAFAHALSSTAPLLSCRADSPILRQPLLQEASADGCPPPAGSAPPSVGPEPHANSLVTSVPCCLVLSLSLPPTWEVLRAGTGSESSLCPQHCSWHVVGVQEKCVKPMKCTKLGCARLTQECGSSPAISSVELGPTSQNSLTEAAGEEGPHRHHHGTLGGHQGSSRRVCSSAGRPGQALLSLAHNDVRLLARLGVGQQPGQQRLPLPWPAPSAPPPDLMVGPRCSGRTPGGQERKEAVRMDPGPRPSPSFQHHRDSRRLVTAASLPTACSELEAPGQR